MEVTLLLQVPEPAFDVPRRWALQQIHDLPPLAGQEYSLYRQEQDKTLALISDEILPGIRVLDPADAFFTGTGPSRISMENVPLYYDDNHLNASGALLLEELLAPLFNVNGEL